MSWFVEQFGKSSLRAPVVLPTDEFFPGRFAGGDQDVRRAVSAMCGYMGVDTGRIRVSLDAELPDGHRGAGRLSTTAGSTSMTPTTAAGTSRRTRTPVVYRRAGGKGLISIDGSLAGTPLLLIATIAQGLARERLVGDKRVTPGRADLGPLADLLTVYLGVGVLTANAALEFSHSTDADNSRLSHWSASRLSYLTEPMYGYALARYAQMRGEHRPSWARFVDPNPRSCLKKGLRFLRHSEPGAPPLAPA